MIFFIWSPTAQNLKKIYFKNLKNVLPNIFFDFFKDFF